ncbi:MAG: histidine--tRNA ligase [Bacilli bacterium]|jgi:histidyl-tRNA synthetase|nr:histidine--tRNA ligase [Bacilli bacterium]
MKEIEIRNVKGTFDYLPEEQRIRNYVTNILTEVFESYGYMPVITPILCYYDVLASKYAGGAEILKEVYQLTDQGKRELALRYDLTVPFAKLITLSKNLPMPFKRYEIGKVFRDGPVKVGRNREFIQCDVDVVGVKDMLIDAEMISLYVTAFSKLKISCTVFMNNRKLMTGILESCGVLDSQMTDVITVIDKFKKLSKEEILKELLDCGMNEQQIERMYYYFNFDFEGIKKLFFQTEHEKIREGLSELQTIWDYLDSLHMTDSVLIDLTLARGLDIYTGTVFEVFAHDSVVTSAIGGGGRYDNIITNFIQDGEEYPAIGCSFGLDAICEIVKEQQKLTIAPSIQLLIVPLETAMESLLLATELRKRGLRVELQYQPRKLSKIFASASRDKIPFVLVLGTHEVQKEKIEVKDMNHQNIKTFALHDYDEICQFIQKNL